MLLFMSTSTLIPPRVLVLVLRATQFPGNNGIQQYSSKLTAISHITIHGQNTDQKPVKKVNFIFNNNCMYCTNFNKYTWNEIYKPWKWKGDIVIRRTFSLFAYDYKDRIFKLVRMFRNLYGSVGKYINFSTGVTSQQFSAFKFVKICVFRTHPSFSRFQTGYNFDQISMKCRGTFQRHEHWNVEMLCNSKHLTSYHCACARDLHGTVMFAIRMINSVYSSLFLDMSPRPPPPPRRPKMSFRQRNVATYIHNVCKWHPWVWVMGEGEGEGLGRQGCRRKKKK